MLACGFLFKSYYGAIALKNNITQTKLWHLIKLKISSWVGEENESKKVLNFFSAYVKGGLCDPATPG